MNIGHDASHIKSSGVRQRLKSDGWTTGMTPETKRSKETVKQSEIRESNALPGELPSKEKVLSIQIRR